MSRELAVDSWSTREAHDDVPVGGDADAGKRQRSSPTYFVKAERFSSGW